MAFVSGSAFDWLFQIPENKRGHLRLERQTCSNSSVCIGSPSSNQLLLSVAVSVALSEHVGVVSAHPRTLQSVVPPGSLPLAFASIFHWCYCCCGDQTFHLITFRANRVHYNQFGVRFSCPWWSDQFYSSMILFLRIQAC